MEREKRMQLRYALSALLFAAPMFAHPLELQLDPASTQISFTLGDILHTVHGTFHLKSANLKVDCETGSAGGSLVVDAGSGESGSDARDNRMRKNVLEAGKFPEITFAPDRVQGPVNLEGSSDVALHGILTIHGDAHEMTLPMHTEASHGQLKASTHFPVPYVKWGMKNPSTLFLRVNDTVEIEIQAVGELRPDAF